MQETVSEKQKTNGTYRTLSATKQYISFSLPMTIHPYPEFFGGSAPAHFTHILCVPGSKWHIKGAFEAVLGAGIKQHKLNLWHRPRALTEDQGAHP